MSVTVSGFEDCILEGDMVISGVIFFLVETETVELVFDRLIADW